MSFIYEGPITLLNFSKFLLIVFSSSLFCFASLIYLLFQLYYEFCSASDIGLGIVNIFPILSFNNTNREVFAFVFGFVEFLQIGKIVYQVFYRFLYIIFLIIAFLLNKIVIAILVTYFFEVVLCFYQFLLILVVKYRLQQRILICQFQQRYIKHRMYFSVLREFKSVVLRSLLFLNTKRSDFNLVQFFSRSLYLKVLSQKIHLILLFKLRRCFSLIL